MRSWLPASAVQQIPNEKPPPCLPVSTIRFTNEFGGQKTPTTAWFASDGSTAWVGMPKQEPGFAVVQSDKWIPAPDAPAAIGTFYCPGRRAEHDHCLRFRHNHDADHDAQGDRRRLLELDDLGVVRRAPLRSLSPSVSGS
jgi:hypothetical protein